MFSIPLDTIYFYITPMITGQFLLLILIYFTLVRRHMIKDFPLHACFIICFILFLIGRPLQYYSSPIAANLIIYARFSLLFSIGIPSLLIANLRRCDIKMHPLVNIIPYVIGSLGSLLYVAIRDGASLQIIFSAKYGYILPLFISDATYRDVLILVTALLLVLPSIYLIHRHLKQQQQYTTLLFLANSLALGLLFIVGEITSQYWCLYLGSFITALCWSWAVYKDINIMKTQATSLKNELKELMLTNENNSPVDVQNLLDNLEINDQDKIDDYKLRIKEALQLLTDSIIEYGADSEAINTRKELKINTILESNNPIDIKNLATNEAIELSAMMINKPTRKNKDLIDKAVSYIKVNYYKDIELGAIANHTNVSDSYLIRIFKKVMGDTINQYITNYRIQQAQFYLKDYSVNETSQAVGFKNPSYFSTVFKKATGISPLQFQKQIIPAKK